MQMFAKIKNKITKWKMQRVIKKSFKSPEHKIPLAEAMIEPTKRMLAQKGETIKR